MKPIWIVDDDQSIRFVLEKALAREDLAVRSFTNPRDVLAALEDGAPQVLVSDIRMPGGSGIDLLTKVKEKFPALPVIIMTAYSDLDSAVSAFQGGAFEYLPPPFPKICSKVNFSATSAAPSLARKPPAAADSSKLMVAPCSSMKSATCRSICRRVCCAC